MLETEIKKLTAEIIALREAFEKMGHPVQMVEASDHEAKGVVLDEEKPETKQKAADHEAKSVVLDESSNDQATIKQTAAPAIDVSVEDLQRYCLQTIRNDRSLKDPIKKLVQDMTGAKFMEDVPADKAGELKAAIEALVGA